MADAKKKELPNIRALKEFRLKGKPIVEGQVISKKDFDNKSDWRNICTMQPTPRGEETDDKVGKPEPEKAEGKGKTKGKDAGGLPGTGGNT